nr:hypothetical protein [Tanacetum cinerariifolium]
FPLAKSLGYCTISLEELAFNLSVEKWLDLVPSSGIISSESIRLRVAASCTVPTPAQHVLQMRVAKSATHISDKAGNDILSFQMREMQSTKGMDVKSRKELIGIKIAGETIALGEFRGSDWSLMDSLWSLKVQKSNERDPHLLLTGPHT